MEYRSAGQRVRVEGSPTAAEKRVIESYVGFRVHLGFSPNTVIVRKRGEGNWCYRLESWPSGSEPVPGPREAPRSLTSLLDWINVLRAREWDSWKAARPGIFPRAAAE